MAEKANVLSEQDRELIDQIDNDFKKFVDTFESPITAF